MAYTYISTTNKTYNLYYSDVILKGGKQARIYFLLPQDKQPNSKNSKLASDLPSTHEIKEIGAHHTPMVYKIINK